ncbi:endo alpha-1,4 polygalactosaminidase [Occultella gossypii]|uniref:Endo alpha-1,4 polygalactosaminidase n=1 Tax=Occultella gossypii TaxID=2800820 RepID=A0ABS7SHJ2_9MICO|nr:endo alpha-1,4 polygalactosaminidase [Occultella gossypii]MBZ2199269.1 endo alpha-1,4 polygalactosaminidase [Occultella gossypii]
MVKPGEGRRRVAPAVLVLALAAVSVGCAGGEPERWSPGSGAAWQIVLAAEPDADVELLHGVTVYDLDGADSSPSHVAALAESGARTICYVNAGAWEDWRDDADEFPAEVIGAAYPGWDGERFLDIRRLDLLAPLMESRLDACAADGFDAVDPDNIDSYDTETGFDLTRADAVTYALWWASAAHERGLAVGQKNAPDLVGDLVDSFDFAVTEDCAADGWCAEMSPYSDAGRPVFAIEYTDRTGSGEFAGFCDDPDLSGFSLILKNRDLDDWRAGCE